MRDSAPVMVPCRIRIGQTARNSWRFLGRIADLRKCGDCEVVIPYPNMARCWNCGLTWDLNHHVDLASVSCSNCYSDIESYAEATR